MTVSVAHSYLKKSEADSSQLPAAMKLRVSAGQRYILAQSPVPFTVEGNTKWHLVALKA